jgi:hypothetical protein
MPVLLLTARTDSRATFLLASAGGRAAIQARYRSISSRLICSGTTTGGGASARKSENRVAVGSSTAAGGPG